MKNFKDKECERQTRLITEGDIFEGTAGGARFMGKERPFVLTEGKNNLYAPIGEYVISYFKDNRISWWRGRRPTGHILSSQMACLNHLFALRKNPDAVLAMLNGIRNEFTEVLPITSDKDNGYIAFEVVSDSDYLNEGEPNRGSNCTSVDALALAKHKSGETWLIPIEWKYTERYNNQDKSMEDRPNESKGTNGKGNERMSRYTNLIDSSKQLKSLSSYQGSLYYFEPFYQLMRQTLWAEQMVSHKNQERLKSDNYLHIHIIPNENDELLHKRYKVSGKGMEESWREMLSDQSKYVIIDPAKLLEPVKSLYPQLFTYLSKRYWDL